MGRASGRGARWGLYTVIAVLAVITVALAALALGRNREPVKGVGETPGYTQQSIGAPIEDSQSQADGGTESSDATNPGGDQPFVAQPAGRVLAAFESNFLMRGASGPCPGTPVVVETTFDGGQTWVPQDLSSVFNMSSLARIVDVGNGAVSAVGWNPDDCSIPAAAVAVQGVSPWEAFEAQNFWRINSADPTTLLGPAGTTAQPGCTAVQLSVGAGERLAVLCQDATVTASLDLGQSWVRTEAPLGGADAIVTGSSNTYVGSVGVESCDGVQITTLDDGMAIVSQSCAGTGAGAVQGQVALATSYDGRMWLWAGDTLLNSADGGQNWG